MLLKALLMISGIVLLLAGTLIAYSYLNTAHSAFAEIYTASIVIIGSCVFLVGYSK